MIPHQRMEQILAVIEANPGITGQDIAAACAVPWSTIQNDLTILLSVTENRIPLYTNADGPEITGDDDDDDEDYDDEDDDDDDDLDDTIKPEHRWFLENYTRRNVPLHLTLGEALQVLDLPYIDEKHPKLLSLKQRSWTIWTWTTKGPAGILRAIWLRQPGFPVKYYFSWSRLLRGGMK